MIQHRLKYIFDFYLNSSIHVALSVAAFAGITFFNLQIEPDSNLLLFIFFSTIVGYNITKYTGSHQSPEAGTKPTYPIVIFTSICLVPLLYFMLLQPIEVILLSVLMGLITFSYSWPFLWRESNLRDITGLKIFIIALVWSVVTVLMPVLTSEFQFDRNLILEFIQRVIFVLALTLPFDIRDARFDTYQLGTIPQIIGIKKTRVLGVLLLLFVGIFEFLKTPLLADQAIILVFIVLLTAFFVMRSVIKQTQYYASFWVESIPIIWCGLLMLL